MIDLATSPYLIGLAKRGAAVKSALDTLIARLGIQVVGVGYIDAMTRLEHVDEFLSELNELGIAATYITLRCECTPESTRRLGCPHGHGGPGHANGYFSEMCEQDTFDVANFGLVAPITDSETSQFVAQCNRLAHEYVTDGMKTRSDYSPCLVPGFWLAVPEHWKSR